MSYPVLAAGVGAARRARETAERRGEFAVLCAGDDVASFKKLLAREQGGEFFSYAEGQRNMVTLAQKGNLEMMAAAAEHMKRKYYYTGYHVDNRQSALQAGLKAASADGVVKVFFENAIKDLHEDIKLQRLRTIFARSVHDNKVTDLEACFKQGFSVKAELRDSFLGVLFEHDPVRVAFNYASRKKSRGAVLSSLLDHLKKEYEGEKPSAVVHAVNFLAAVRDQSPNNPFKWTSRHQRPKLEAAIAHFRGLMK